LLLAKLQLLAKTMSRSICVISKVLIIILSHFAQVNISVFFEKFLKRFICCGRKRLWDGRFSQVENFSQHRSRLVSFRCLRSHRTLSNTYLASENCIFDSYLTRPVMHSRKKVLKCLHLFLGTRCLHLCYWHFYCFDGKIHYLCLFTNWISFVDIEKPYFVRRILSLFWLLFQNSLYI